MSAQGRSERYSPMAFSASPTKPTQPALLGTLPIEIITTIIEQVLPKNVPNEFNIDLDSCFECVEALKMTAPHPDQQPRSQTEHRYAILYINKKIYPETLRILRARTFRIKIGQGNLLCMASTTEKIRERLFTDEVWGPVFPGLDLRELSELAIDIAPTRFHSDWSHARNVLSALCEEQLFPRGPIKKLSIKVEDMKRSKMDPLWFFQKEFLDFEDYKNVLQPCERVVAAADQCEIHLPYWMERHEAKDRLIEEWGKLGASIVFVPASFSCLSSEEEELFRRLEELAPLPKDLLVSRGSGAV